MWKVFLLTFVFATSSFFADQVSASQPIEIKKKFQDKNFKDKKVVINISEKHIGTDVVHEKKIYDLIMAAIEAGHEEVIVNFEHAETIDLKFVDNLFGGMLNKFGFAWFINHRIMVDAENKKIAEQIREQVASLLHSAHEAERIAKPPLPLKPINMKKWQSIPCIKGRLATQQDCDDGIAGFVLKVREGDFKIQPMDLELPLCAIYTEDDGTKMPVIITQAEEIIDTGGQYIRAVDVFTGGNILGTKESFEILKMPDERFYNAPVKNNEVLTKSDIHPQTTNSIFKRLGKFFSRKKGD